MHFWHIYAASLSRAHSESPSGKMQNKKSNHQILNREICVYSISFDCTFHEYISWCTQACFLLCYYVSQYMVHILIHRVFYWNSMHVVGCFVVGFHAVFGVIQFIDISLRLCTLIMRIGFVEARKHCAAKKRAFWIENNR